MRFDAEKFILEMKLFTKKLTPKSAKQLLVDAGICTKKGNLRKPYK